MNVGYKFFHLVFLLFFILQAHYSMGKRRLPAKWKEKVDKTCRRLNNMFPVYEEKKESLQMPNMDGAEVVRNIRKLNRTDALTIPVIAMTANAFKEDIQKCMDAGMNEHLAKPVDIKKMLEVLGSYRRKWNNCEKRRNL